MNTAVAALLALCVGPLAASLAFAAEAPESGYWFRKENQEWRKKRRDSLVSETGWLTLIGLHWLEPGENSFGSDPSNPFVLPEGTALPRAGTILLDGTRVRIRAERDSRVMLDGKPVVERDLRTDEKGSPDVLRIGRLSFFVIRRGDRYGVRVKDPSSPTRVGFRGIDYFPLDPAHRVTGDLVAYEKPKDVEIPTVLGTTEVQKSPGYVKFRLKGKDLTLEPVVEDPSKRTLFFVFKDETSGKETYPGGRFLYAEARDDGKVVLDFNQAFNPPCAFTPYATCPLPPRQNVMPVRVEAGEKTYGDHVPEGGAR